MSYGGVGEFGDMMAAAAAQYYTFSFVIIFVFDDITLFRRSTVRKPNFIGIILIHAEISTIVDLIKSICVSWKEKTHLDISEFLLLADWHPLQAGAAVDPIKTIK